MVSDLSTTLHESFQYGSSLFDSTSRSTPSKIPLLGYPLYQSLAPLVHNYLFAAKGLALQYHLLESTDPYDLLKILLSSESESSDGRIGAAVTMPHKVAFMSLVDDVTPEARAIGAINTIFIRLDRTTGKRRHIGTNTDCIGIGKSFTTTPSFLEQHPAGKERPALVVGGGGASRSAIYALHHLLGVSEIYLVSRLKSETDDITAWFTKTIDASFKAKLRPVHSLDEAKTLPTPYYVVGAVPDFPPKTEAEKMAQAITRELLGRQNEKTKGVVLEMCYHPNIRTSFYDFAEQNGWQVIPGTVAMIWQGVAQHILWTETELTSEGSVVEDLTKVVEDEIKRRS